MKIHSLPSLTRTALTGCRLSGQQQTAAYQMRGAGAVFRPSVLCRLRLQDVPSPGRSVKTEKEYYTCGGYSKRVHPCTTHHITLNVLKQLVMADLQRVTQFAAEHEKQFVDMLVEDSMQEQKRAFAEMQRTLDTQRARHSELDVIIQRLYEDNIKGKLSDERFAKMSAGYEAGQAGLADSIQELTAALSEKKDKTANISRFLSLVKRNLSFEDLTRDVLNTFIQKIVVHEVDKSSGQRVQKINIYYNFVGKIEGA